MILELDNILMPELTESYQILHFDEYPIVFVGKNHHGTDIIGSFIFEDETNDTLQFFICEISTLMLNGFLRKKVNLLIMMNCNMMNLHCIGALNDSTDYFVAPSTGIDEPGYNYCAIMDFINSSIDIELTNHRNTDFIQNLRVLQVFLNWKP